MTVLPPGRHVPTAQPPARLGRLVLDTSYSSLTPQLQRCCVQVTVDDLPLRVGWGRTTVDVPAGRHLVEIEVDHGRGWGVVADAVPVAAGDVVTVFYRAPVRSRAAGALGPVPQPTLGTGALAARLLVALLGLVLVGVFALGVLLPFG